METINTIIVNKNDLIINGELNSKTIPLRDLNVIEIQTINNFKTFCFEKLQSYIEPIPIPEGPSVYTMIKPCPVRGDLTVNIYDTNYSNDKAKQIISIDILALHFDESGERVTMYDATSFVIADMSEERKVEIADGVYEYSYTLANTMLQNSVPINSLIAMAIQTADADGSLNKRLYNL